MKVAFTLTGDTAMLMHADNIERADELIEWRKRSENKNISVAGDDRSPAWTWQTYLYDDGKNIAMPAENLMVALRTAGTQMILKKQKTFKEITQSGMMVNSEFCEFRTGGKQVPIDRIEAIKDEPFSAQANAVKDMGFRLFMKRARVGQSKHVRVRPRFDDWQVSGTITVMKPEITMDVLVRLFELAGSVGLSDWRPGCRTPGPFGMFSSKLSKVA